MTPQNASPRRQATAIELSALLVQSVVTPAPGEQEAASAFAAQTGLSAEQLVLELLHVRAFAVQLALQVSLSDDPAAAQLRAQYHAHWEQAADQDGAAWELLQQRLADCTAATEAGTGLRAAVGACFARWFDGGAPVADLAHLGGQLFGALFDEVCELLGAVELSELDDDGE